MQTTVLVLVLNLAVSHVQGGALERVRIVLLVLMDTNSNLIRVALVVLHSVPLLAQLLVKAIAMEHAALLVVLLVLVLVKEIVKEHAQMDVGQIVL